MGFYRSAQKFSTTSLVLGIICNHQPPEIQIHHLWACTVSAASGPTVGLGKSITIHIKQQVMMCWSSKMVMLLFDFRKKNIKRMKKTAKPMDLLKHLKATSSTNINFSDGVCLSHGKQTFLKPKKTNANGCRCRVTHWPLPSSAEPCASCAGWSWCARPVPVLGGHHGPKVPVVQILNQKQKWWKYFETDQNLQLGYDSTKTRKNTCDSSVPYFGSVVSKEKQTQKLLQRFTNTSISSSLFLHSAPRY